METYRVAIVSQGTPRWVSYHDTLADVHKDVLRYGHQNDKVIVHYGHLACDGEWEPEEEVLIFWVEEV
jgi:hypothetical protein